MKSESLELFDVAAFESMDKEASSEPITKSPYDKGFHEIEPPEFFNRDAQVVAKDLLGKVLQHKVEDFWLSGKYFVIKYSVGLRY